MSPSRRERPARPSRERPARPRPQPGRGPKGDPALIWLREEPSARRPTHTRADIAGAALEIADAEGFDAVSMRRVAQKLGAGTMTLYHYVANKDELITLMVDAVMGEVLVPDGELAGDWRAAMEQIAKRSHDAFANHRWTLDRMGEMRPGPNFMRHFEQSLQAVESAGLVGRGELRPDRPGRRLRLRLRPARGAGHGRGPRQVAGRVQASSSSANSTAATTRGSAGSSAPTPGPESTASPRSAAARAASSAASSACSTGSKRGWAGGRGLAWGRECGCAGARRPRKGPPPPLPTKAPPRFPK